MLKIKRLLALYIDFMIIIIISTLLTNIVTLGHFNLSSSLIIKCIASFIYLCLVFCLTITKDLIFKNASIGKRIFRLGILYEDGNIPSRKELVKRMLTDILLFPVNIILIIVNNKTTADAKCKTKVIEIIK